MRESERERVREHRLRLRNLENSYARGVDQEYQLRQIVWLFTQFYVVNLNEKVQSVCVDSR